MPTRILFPDKPCNIVRHGRKYSGQWRAENGKLHVASAYGSKDVPEPSQASYDALKATACTVLAEIVEARYGA